MAIPQKPFQIPLCPQCGTPARNVILLKGRVRCQLRDDGTPGPILSTSRDVPAARQYECGGRHVWSLAGEAPERLKLIVVTVTMTKHMPDGRTSLSNFSGARTSANADEARGEVVKAALLAMPEHQVALVTDFLLAFIEGDTIIPVDRA